MLVLWEAQFGDFANGAQLIIDQYIACSESKWGETSSIRAAVAARLSRAGAGAFQRAARALLASLRRGQHPRVANPSTPASYFHILRRQALRKIKKPLVLMTPKGMLRDPRCTSPIAELASGRLLRKSCPTPLRRGTRSGSSFAAGKVYFDLDDQRKAQKVTDTAIIRIEQLYPLHEKKLQAVVAPYSGAERARLVPRGIRKHGSVAFPGAAFAQALWPRSPVRRPRCFRQHGHRFARYSRSRATGSWLTRRSVYDFPTRSSLANLSRDFAS